MNPSLILVSTAVAVMSAYMVPTGQLVNGSNAVPGNGAGCGIPTSWVAPADMGAPLQPLGGGETITVTNSGSSSYVINGQLDPPLTLTRGVTYVFVNNAFPGHPLLIRTTAGGTNLGAAEGVSGNGTATVSFTPDLSLASPVVYQCQFHSSMLGTITLVDPAIQVSPKAMLEGPFNAGTGVMADALRTLPGFPTTEPYTALSYVHAGGGGGESVAPGVLAVTGNNAIVDWVVVELRDVTAPTAVLATRSALVQRDGDVVGTDGTSALQFGLGAGNYHLALRHRNHLGIMTLNAVALSGSPTLVDFTTASTACFGTAARKTVGSAQVLWAGDVTFNGADQYTGSSNDRDPILVTVGSTTPNNTVLNTYSTRDVNLNGNVQYTGSGNDRDPILVNVGSTTPNNVRVQQLP